MILSFFILCCFSQTYKSDTVTIISEAGMIRYAKVEFNIILTDTIIHLLNLETCDTTSFKIIEKLPNIIKTTGKHIDGYGTISRGINFLVTLLFYENPERFNSLAFKWNGELYIFIVTNIIFIDGSP